MEPYYERDGITIYHGDCREMLPTITPGACVITDPPYLGARGQSWEGDRVPLSVDYTPADSQLLIWLVNECQRIVTDGWSVIFQDFPGAMFLRESMGCAGMMVPYAPVIWCKPAGAYTPVGSANSVPKSVDFITVARQGKAFDCQRPGHYVSPPYSPKKELFRVGGKPVELMRSIIEDYAAEDQTIVDPFLGGGTTLVAARDLGREAIGIEIEERYCEIAAKRLAQGVLGFGGG